MTLLRGLNTRITTWGSGEISESREAAIARVPFRDTGKMVVGELDGGFHTKMWGLKTGHVNLGCAHAR